VGGGLGGTGPPDRDLIACRYRQLSPLKSCSRPLMVISHLKHTVSGYNSPHYTQTTSRHAFLASETCHTWKSSTFGHVLQSSLINTGQFASTNFDTQIRCRFSPIQKCQIHRNSLNPWICDTSQHPGRILTRRFGLSSGNVSNHSISVGPKSGYAPWEWHLKVLALTRKIQKIIVY